ncbi:lysozyme family protein [Actibacterium mucosum]|nr:lytic transglycosylase domain-containing protein [Actibacterium mucosum]
MEGKGVWFDSHAELLDYAQTHHARGARSYDVGCFQLNFKWHGHNFSSIEQMIQPDANALYAARFLLELYREKGNWTDAAGAYHSRTPKYANKYKARFDTFRAIFLAEDNRPLETQGSFALAGIPQDKPRPRVNAFPLLQSGTGNRGLGSLVPMTSAGPGLFGQGGS